MSAQTRPIKDLWLWSSARQEFVQAQLRNLFQHVSIPYSRSITFSVVIVFFGCLGGCGNVCEWLWDCSSKEFLSDLSHWASVASTGRAGFDREDDEWLRTEYVGTRWYRAPEARGERMLILSGIFEMLVGGEKQPWMRQNNWLQVSTNHSQTSWRLWRSVSERIPTKHPQSFATLFSIFGFPRWCSPPRNTQLLLICGASVAYWESLWAERSCFLPRFQQSLAWTYGRLNNILVFGMAFVTSGPVAVPFVAYFLSTAEGNLWVPTLKCDSQQV